MKSNILLTSFGVIAAIVVIFIGTIDPKTGFPEPITVDGQTIEFTWTDDNKNEDLIIYTDKATYTDGIAHADVYVAVENRSGVDQDIELMGYFRDSKQKIGDISVLTEATKEVPTYETKQECLATTRKVATTTCSDIQVQTGTTTETYKTWQKLEKTTRTVLEKTREQSTLVDVTRKSVENFIAPTKSISFLVPNGGVVYYKVLIEFPANSDDNFYFETVGNQGGYGHLDPWFNASWTYKVKLEVVPTKVGTSTAITSFPVYVDLSNLPADFHTNVKADGCDIRMVESDDTTETAFELVSYASTTDTGELHFMADALATTSTSTFYMYYGNSGASCYAVTDTYGRNAVWTGFEGVWHFNTNSTDSTANGRNGTDTNITYGTGKLGGSAYNLSKNGKIAVGSWSLTAAFSVSFWIKYDSLSDIQTAFSTYNGSGAGGGTVNAYPYLFPNTEGVLSNFIVDSGGVDLNQATATWYHYYYTHNGTTVTTYFNGAQVDTGAVTHDTTTRVFNWMSRGDEASQRMDGYIEEGKVKNSQLPQAWILTEYNNQSSPSTFYVVGVQETNGGGGGGAIHDGGVVWFD